MNVESLNWIAVDDGYQVALDAGKIVCMNKKGSVLKSVPKKVRELDAVVELKQMTEWLAEHERACRQTVDAWMLGSLPVPRAAIESVWVDPSWRAVLENAVVAPQGWTDEEELGFLRGIDREKGVGFVNIDGESIWIQADELVILHPILIPPLDDFRELAIELEVEQGLTQIMREVHTKPAELAEEQTSIRTLANGKFAQLMHALGKCRQLGYSIRGGYAQCKVIEDGKHCEARYWIGYGDPEWETYTGDLIWVDQNERTVDLKDVGPVAFSEGMRMANAIYSARVVEENEDA